ncbi:DUF3325 domain-containing protein [Diaphorobacter nitroreducens]|uniref:DUF3325 domain-containing protein n=1 Tax=Diaphorobacter nitroreducens TaxID=164759 RepID=UPI0035AEBB51
MNAMLLVGLACITAFAGFTALALAMERHFEDLFGRGKSMGAAQRMGLRTAGAVALALALGACLLSHGASQGWVLWLGVLTAAALGVVLLLSYGPRAQ